jgi:protein phosphatase
MRYLPGNAQHIGARHSQQDSFGFLDPEDRAFISHGGFLAVVCDGMGGMEHGDAASRTAVKAFLEAYQRKTPDEPIPAALERAVRDANQQVVALANNLGMSEGIGTTLVATALTGTSMYFISVGDSGLFHISGGQIQTVNRPHIFANVLDQAVARGTMSREDAENHPERESLTSYIGSGKLAEIDHNQDPWPLLEGDTVLLASDGLFKTLENDEIITCLQGNPQAWAEALVTRTLSKQREYQDNVTVLSVTVESDTSAAIPRTVLMKPPPAVALGSSQNAVPPPLTAGAPPIAITPPNLAPPPPPIAPGVAALPPLPLPPETAPSSRRNFTFLALLLIAAVLAGGWWWMKQRKPPALAPATPERQTQPTASPSDKPEKVPDDPAATDPRTPAPAGTPPNSPEKEPQLIGEPAKPEKTAQPLRPGRRTKKQEPRNQ